MPAKNTGVYEVFGTTFSFFSFDLPPPGVGLKTVTDTSSPILIPTSAATAAKVYGLVSLIVDIPEKSHRG